jgi:hypothetical protein
MQMETNSDRMQHVPMWLRLALLSYFLSFIVSHYFPYIEPSWLMFFRQWLLPVLLFSIFVHFGFFHRWKAGKRTSFEMRCEEVKLKGFSKVINALFLALVSALFCWIFSIFSWGFQLYSQRCSLMSSTSLMPK